MNVNLTSNYLTNSVVAAQQFVGQAVAKVQGNIERTPWGYYKSTQDPTSKLVGEQLKNVKAAAEVNQDYGLDSKIAASISQACDEVGLLGSLLCVCIMQIK